MIIGFATNLYAVPFMFVIVYIRLINTFSLYHEGRNRGLQGLASAILKQWEKSLIAKIAVKYGIPNTDNEKMANELKVSLVEVYFTI